MDGVSNCRGVSILYHVNRERSEKINGTKIQTIIYFLGDLLGCSIVYYFPFSIVYTKMLKIGVGDRIKYVVFSTSFIINKECILYINVKHVSVMSHLLLVVYQDMNE